MGVGKSWESQISQDLLSSSEFSGRKDGCSRVRHGCMEREREVWKWKWRWGRKGDEGGGAGREGRTGREGEDETKGGLINSFTTR